MSEHSLQGTTFAVATLGCKVNQADSESIGEQMSAAGSLQRDFHEAADIYIVNTCTVTHLGDRSSRNMIAQAHRHHPDALLVVTGCYAELNPGAVAQLPGVALVVGNTHKETLVEAIAQLRHESDAPTTAAFPPSLPTTTARNIPLPMLPLDSQHIGSDQPFATEEEPQPDNPSPSTGTQMSSRTRVQMKVQDGCDNRCTYCIVPTVRGKSRSRSIASIVEHVQRKVRAGFKEIVLTGIHLGDYHPDGDEQLDLGDLIAALLHETAMPRIRVSSLEPEDFRLEWLTLWENPRLCRHFHLPMQSGSDAILRRMARRYDTTRYRTIIETARRLIPGLAISTDIITGFPGESEADFEQTYQLAQALAFAKMHVFRFSPREGTAAARMRGHIRDDVKKLRSERLLALNEEHSQRFRQQFLGQTLEVLVEHPRGGRWEGLTDNYVRVELHDLPQQTQSWQHTLLQAHLTHLVEDGVYGVFSENHA